MRQRKNRERNEIKLLPCFSYNWRKALQTFSLIKPCNFKYRAPVSRKIPSCCLHQFARHKYRVPQNLKILVMSEQNEGITTQGPWVGKFQITLCFIISCAQKMDCYCILQLRHYSYLLQSNYVFLVVLNLLNNLVKEILLKCMQKIRYIFQHTELCTLCLDPLP